jgi:hypothetical protein
MGFVLTKPLGLVGIKLHHAGNMRTTHIAPWAQTVLADLRTYAEWGPNGMEIHAWLFGTLPSDNRAGQFYGHLVEMCTAAGFFDVTGLAIPGAPSAMEQRTSQLAALHARIFGADPRARTHHADETQRMYPGLQLRPQDEAVLGASAISREVALARGYTYADTKIRLAQLGFAPDQQRAPALVIPVYGVLASDGRPSFYSIRPDSPRVTKGKNGKPDKPKKYEIPVRTHVVVDVNPLCRVTLADPTVPLAIVEGIKKADALLSANVDALCVVAILGTWSWRGTNAQGGKAVLADWDGVALRGREIYVGYDSDAQTNPEVWRARERLARMLEAKGRGKRDGD